MLPQLLISIAVLCLALSQLHSVRIAAAPVSSCDDNFTLVGDKCLLAVGKWSDWYQSDRHCHSLGAALLSLQSESQLELINNWLLDVAPYRKFWTSGNNLLNESTYYWQSTGEKAQYLPWAEGSPIRWHGNCLMLYADYVDWELVGYSLVVRNGSWWGPHICEHKPHKY